MKKRFITAFAVAYTITAFGCSSGRQVIVVNRLCSPVPNSAVAADFIPNGWKLIETVSPTKFDVKNVEFLEIAKSGEFQVSGIDLRNRAAKLEANMGLDDAIRILAEQEKLPREARQFEVLFTGTIVLDNLGMMNVAALRYNGHCWELQWLNFDETSHYSTRNRVPHI